MRCSSPLRATKTIFGDISYRKASSGQFLEFECRKCIACRLNMAREKAVRSIHEAQMHKSNIFLTLTYDEAHLSSDRLIKEDYQKFIQDLRDFQRQRYPNKTNHEIRMPYMVTGEYGEENKRPHWHFILFNYEPLHPEYYYTSDSGHSVYKSIELDEIWAKGKTEYGSVTLDSAGYVARYAAKKLVHGNDEEHDYHPIHNTSRKYPIGKTWIEKYWKRTFQNGNVIIQNGDKKIPSKIPRYYSDWLKKYKPDEFERYVTEKRKEICEKAMLKARKEEIEWFTNNVWETKSSTPYYLKPKPAKVKETILKSKFKRLQETLKL